MTTTTVTTQLVPGQSYIGITTGMRRGVRIYHAVAFVAARSTVEPFIRERETTPEQDRVFMVRERFGSSPALFLRGSIRMSTPGKSYRTVDAEEIPGWMRRAVTTPHRARCVRLGLAELLCMGECTELMRAVEEGFLPGDYDIVEVPAVIGATS